MRLPNVMAARDVCILGARKWPPLYLSATIHEVRVRHFFIEYNNNGARYIRARVEGKALVNIGDKHVATGREYRVETIVHLDSVDQPITVQMLRNARWSQERTYCGFCNEIRDLFRRRREYKRGI